MGDAGGANRDRHLQREDRSLVAHTGVAAEACYNGDVGRSDAAAATVQLGACSGERADSDAIGDARQADEEGGARRGVVQGWRRQSIGAAPSPMRTHGR